MTAVDSSLAILLQQETLVLRRELLMSEPHQSFAWDFGRVQQVAVGDLISGDTSGAVGIVSSISVTSGTIASSDAAGTLWVNSYTGVFVNGENVDVDSPSAADNVLNVDVADGDEVNAYIDRSRLVNRWPQLTRKWDDLRPISINLDMINDDGVLNRFRDTPSTLVSSVEINLQVGNNLQSNHLQYSEQFQATVWAGTLTVSHAVIQDPFGSMRASRLLETAVTSQAHTYKQTFFSAGGPAEGNSGTMHYTALWVKVQSNFRYFHMRPEGSAFPVDSVPNGIIFDMQDGDFIYEGSSVQQTYSNSDGSGWYRVAAEMPYDETPNLIFEFAVNSGLWGDDEAGVVGVFGAQLSSGTGERTYIQTTSPAIESALAGLPYEEFPVRLFSGQTSMIAYQDGKANLRVTDKLKDLSQQLVGNVDSAVSYSGSDYLVGDLAWWLATSYGGFDTTADSNNVDINYESWAAWSGVFSGSSVFMNANFNGQTVTAALRKIARMTDSAIYLRENKLNFQRFITQSSLSVALDLDRIVARSKVSVTLDEAAIVNKQAVYADYDVSSQNWGIYTFDVDSDSAATYGVRERIEKDQNIWYTTSATAQDFAQRRTSVVGNPWEQVVVRTGLNAAQVRIGDMMSVTEPILGFTETTRVVARSFNLADGTIILEGASNQLTGGFQLDVSTYNGTDVLL